MKKQVLTGMTMLGLFLTLAVASVYAQSNRKIEATIPFDFTVGGTKLHSGIYTVTARSALALMIRSMDGKSTAIVLTEGISKGQASAKSKLVFRWYDEQYFLSEVWTGGENSGHQLFKSRHERVLARNLATMASKNLTQPGNGRVEIIATLQ